MVGVAGGEIRLKDEGTHSSWVEVVGPYEIAARPTTVGLYLQVTEEVDAAMQESNLPMTEVSWLDAVRFCNRLSQSEGLEEVYLIDRDPDGLDVVCNMGAGGYRLPTEGEWELACRAGSSDVRYGVLDEIGWYAGNSAGRVHDAATNNPTIGGCTTRSGTFGSGAGISSMLMSTVPTGCFGVVVGAISHAGVVHRVGARVTLR